MILKKAIDVIIEKMAADENHIFCDNCKIARLLDLNYM
jgi:hypothetical protein